MRLPPGTADCSRVISAVGRGLPTRPLFRHGAGKPLLAAFVRDQMTSVKWKENKTGTWLGSDHCHLQSIL